MSGEGSRLEYSIPDVAPILNMPRLSLVHSKEKTLSSSTRFESLGIDFRKVSVS